MVSSNLAQTERYQAPALSRRRTGRLCYSLLLLLIFGTNAWAQQFGLPAMVRNVGIDQKLNAQLPLELTFKDETGQSVRLGEYFVRKPVVLALVYYECPMLCDMVLNGLLHSMEKMTLDIGKDFEVVTVSFNPQESWQLAQNKKTNYLEKFNRPEARQGWHFLTGQEAAIKQLADSVGFRYTYDPRTKQFAHASGVMVITPEGKVSRYFYGIQYEPRDLRLGLVEASNHKIGSPVDELLLFCFHYDPTTGKYGMAIMNTIRALGSATVLALGTLLFVLIRKDRHKSAPSGWRSV